MKKLLSIFGLKKEKKKKRKKHYFHYFYLLILIYGIEVTLICNFYSFFFN